MSAIQPKVLAWARETAGLSIEDAARSLALAPARGQSGAQRLHAMESGQAAPTRPLLLKMARVYHRPLLVFYLAEPPKAGNRGHDFRTLPARQRFNPELDALARDIQARQGLIRSMLEDEGTDPPDFIASTTTELTAPRLAACISHRLDFNLDTYRAAGTQDAAFAYLRETIEASGVYVLLLGNLGSHHTNIPVDVFRGFALADSLAPMLVINDQDARAAWPFTAFHELAHLWLGHTGVSGTDTENQIERYCNEVAGELLLPAGELRHLPIAPTSGLDSLAAEIGRLAQACHVSRAMVAYRLYRLDHLGRSTWDALDRRFAEEYRQSQQLQAERNRQADGGPNYYVVRRHRVGRALLRLVRRSLDEGTITYTKAGRVLGVKPRSVEPLLSTPGVR